MRITLYIKELLFKKDCVIVPDLGGFVAQHRSAFLHPSQHTFLPPSRRVAFNASLRTGDGLLAFHIASRLGLNYSEATEWIKEQVNGIWEKMLAGEKVVLDEIGTLVLDSGKRIQFEPDPHGNFLDQSFGLSSIHSPAIRRENEPVRIKRLKETSGNRNSKLWRLLELVPVAAVLLLLLLNPRVITTLNTGLANLLPVVQWNNDDSQPVAQETEVSPVQEPNREVEGSVVSIDDQSGLSDTNQASLPEPVSHVTEVETTRVEVDLPVVVNDPSPGYSDIHSQGFHVIGGCFRIEKNARRLVRQAQSLGYSARIIGQNDEGLYVVSLYSSGQLNQAEEILKNVRTGFEKNAWVLVK